jgi:hypothetical protein
MRTTSKMADLTWQYRVLRWTVPVDDHTHEVGGGPVLHVASRETGRVEVWTEEYVCDQTFETSAPKRQVQAFGTGQPLSSNNLRTHIGSALDGPFVWHLYSTGR